tara:strand:- start:58 stop:495 length:438 start_codon:yes stop_codon:yes gene_type:complete
MEKFTGNFKKISLNSKVWGDPNFDEVPLIVLVEDLDGDTSGVWAGIYEGPEESDENELDEDGVADPFRTFYMQACFKLSECIPPKYEGGKKWIRQGSGENGEEGMSTWIFGFGNIDEVYTPKANIDLDAAMELWLQQIRDTALGP